MNNETELNEIQTEQVSAEEDLQQEQEETTLPQGKEGENKEESSEQNNSDSKENDKDKNFEQVEWIKRRLERQERSHRRETQEQLQKLQTEFVQQIPQIIAAYVAPQSVAGNVTQNQNIPMQNAGVSQEQQWQQFEEHQKNQAFANRANKMVEKYDDYEDIVTDAKTYLTPTMIMTLRELPEDSLENFYKCWKEDSNKIKKISRLPPVKQALELARLDAEMSTKAKSSSTETQNNSSQSNSIKKVISPLKPQGSNLTSALDMKYSDMVKKYKRK